MKPSGRLELTWANKGLRLLAHDDQSFTWVERGDFRVTEVRLLRELETVGAPSDNLLIRGDALNALTALTHLPGYRERYAGRVKLCYIDPPFNTGQAFVNYDDALESSAWLTFMRDRLEQIRDLLAHDGSVWVHLDDAQQHRARMVLDEVFGAENFLGTVIWKRRNDPRNTATHLSADHDYILVYARDATRCTFRRLARSETMDAAYTNPDDDPRGPWRRSDLAARNYYSKGLYAVTTPSGRQIDGPPSGSYWRVSEEELRRLDGEGRIYWGSDGTSRPYLKRFLADVAAGRVPGSVWGPEEVGFVRNGKEEVRALIGDVFATPKPERLVERILQIGTSPGDLILDCFAGAGTTPSVAQKMGRRWVAVELREDTVGKYLLPRLRKVVAGEDPGGITAAAKWTGGGGFRLMEVAPSMFEEVEGTVVLADWATGGALAQAVAAQFGYTFDPQAPFAGHRGRSRLAVIDGVLSPEVVRYLAQRLVPGEGLLIVAEAIEPGTPELASSLVRGAKVRKVPRDLARVGRQLTLPFAAGQDPTGAQP